MISALEYLWYQHKFLGYFFFPLHFLFRLLATLRKRYLLNKYQEVVLDKPVIVVGNITVGGTGKTPVVIALVKYLQSKGYKPGVISRGYGGVADYPYQLNDASTAAQSGDEPLLIFKRCGCPVVVSPLRVEAARFLLQHNHVDVIVSDDGLQHYALPRNIEIAIIDGARGLGNGLCLPAGPLREPASRLKEVDFVLVNGRTDLTFDKRQHHMHLQVQPLVPLPATLQHRGLPSHSKINAVAAIGNPSRFFATLDGQGYQLIEHVFPDHYLYTESDLNFDNGLPVVMTEKDAIKCAGFASLDQHWFLPVDAILPKDFLAALEKKLKLLKKG